MPENGIRQSYGIFIVHHEQKYMDIMPNKFDNESNK
jgi:hypothetical protein